MATEELNQFLAELEKYQILNPSQLHETRKLSQSHRGPARELAKELIGRGWLTPFQANQLLQQRGQNLVLGSYVLVERLGQGGMGQVYKARNVLLDRLVALKVIRDDRLNQPEALSRFRREMQGVARLSHPHVVLAHDADRIGDTYVLVMEYIEGPTLARLLQQRGRLHSAEASSYVRHAALGLQHAQERGLVHRDIKPSNLILSVPEGVVKVLDLGLARLRPQPDSSATESHLTSPGALMGTPDYLAPEQAVNSHQVDIRADVYSLGCTFYHLLAGQPPFPGGSLPEKLLKHQQAEPEPLERFCPELPPGLAQVVHKMMAKRPEDRYQTPQEVADALSPFASGEPASSALKNAPLTETKTISPNESPARKTPAQLFRNYALLPAALGLLATLLSIPVVLALRHPATGDRPNGQAKEPPAPDAQPPRPPDKGPERDPRDNRPGEPAQLPEFPADGVVRLVKDLRGHTGVILALSFSPDGKDLATGGDDQQVRLWDARTGDPKGDPLRQGQLVRALAWSPDARGLVSGGWDGIADADLKLWDLQAPGKARTLAWKDRPGIPMSADLRAVAFSPDGKQLATGGGPLRLWDLTREGTPVVLPWQKLFPSYLYGVAFSPDGKRVAAGCHDTGDSVRVWEVGQPDEPILLRGNEQTPGLIHSDVRGVVAFVAGGKRLVRVTSAGWGFGESAGSVLVWDHPARKEFHLRDKFKIPAGTVYALVSSANGDLRIAVADGVPDFRPDPNTPPGPVKLWDSATGKVASFETGHKGSIRTLAFSPDGTRLATGSSDQSVKLWNLTR